MPPVKNETTPAEGGIRMATRMFAMEITTAGAAGRPAPIQQDTQVEQACT